MIKNERQLSIAQAKHTELLTAAATANNEDDAAVFISLADDLAQEISEYVAVVTGEENVFKLESVDDLTEVVVKARLAQGWTQKQLADELGVSEQMVQRDEAGGYARAGLGRLADAVDALGYTLIGELRPAHLPEAQWRRRHEVTLGNPVGVLQATWIKQFELAPDVAKVTASVTSVGSISADVHMLTQGEAHRRGGWWDDAGTNALVIFHACPPMVSNQVVKNRDVSTRRVEPVEELSRHGAETK
jgi:transcriptional regulator with XRE-family HTH domain